MKDLKILVVDDMPTMRDALASLLHKVGFKKINKAVDGQDAYTKIEAAQNEEAPYELIFCDIIMPNMSGLELLKKMSNDANFKEIPVIMVSTENEYNIVIDAISAGAKDYIIKPYTQEAVLKKLQSVIK